MGALESKMGGGGVASEVHNLTIIYRIYNQTDISILELLPPVERTLLQSFPLDGRNGDNRTNEPLNHNG